MRTGLLMAIRVKVVAWMNGWIRVVRVVVRIRVGVGYVSGGVEGVDIVGKCLSEKK